MNDDSAFRVPLLEHSLPRRTFGKAVISASTGFYRFVAEALEACTAERIQKHNPRGVLNHSPHQPVTTCLQAFAQQLALAGPLSINLVAGNACAIINLLFVARGGTTQLAGKPYCAELKRARAATLKSPVASLPLALRCKS